MADNVSIAAEILNDPAGRNYAGLSPLAAFEAFCEPLPASTEARDANLAQAATALAALAALGDIGASAHAALLLACEGEAPRVSRRDAVLGPASFVSFTEFASIYEEAL